MVPGAPRRFAVKCPAPGWPSAPQLLPHRLPHRQVVKQPSPRKRGRNGNVLENQPRKDENAGEVCDFRGLRTHFAPAASAQWKLPLSPLPTSLHTNCPSHLTPHKLPFPTRSTHIALPSCRDRLRRALHYLWRALQVPARIVG
eukprot:364999-Chlamydomonas_euryale.AAC.2